MKLQFSLLAVLVLLVSIVSAQTTPCDNIFDYDGDGHVVMSDLLMMFSVFGDTDVDQDGIWDSEDLCIDMASANFSANPTEPCTGAAGFVCGVDSVMYDGHYYKTTSVGSQCWFSENCRYLPEVSPSADGSSVAANYYVYGYEGIDVAEAKATSNYDLYGVLYNYQALTQGGLCPSNWHTATDAEWQTLETSLGMDSTASLSSGWRGTDQATQLKTTYGWAGNGSGTNSSEFACLPGGYRDANGNFGNESMSGYWWAATPQGTGNAWFRNIYLSNGSIYRHNYLMSSGYSVRCLMD